MRLSSGSAGGLLAAILMLASCTPAVSLLEKDAQASLGATAVRLDGLWRYFPGQQFEPVGSGIKDPELLWNSPGSMALQVPGIWDSIAPTLGRGVYQVRLTGLTPGQLYAVQFKGINSHAQLWADKLELGSWGATGLNFVPQVYTWTPQSSETLLTVSVDNHILASGGLWLPVLAGPHTAVEDAAATGRLGETLLIGAVVMMGLYHLALFFFRTRDRAPLYFGIFCLLSSLKASLSGEQLLAAEWPGFDQVLGLRLAYLDTILLPIVFSAYMQAMFPVARYRVLMTLLGTMAFVQGIVCLVTSPYYLQAWFWPYQIVILVCCTYFLGILILALRNRKLGAGLMLLGFLVIFASAANDVLHDNKLIVTFYSLNLGLFIFLFTQTLVMGGVLSRSFRRVEELNDTLELRVVERTRDLEIQSRSDSLTGLMNRRYFWTLLTQEWERWLRYTQDFSLAMVDIDHFKAVNDRFGHSAGDEALLMVSELLQKSVRKSDSVSRYGGEEFCLLLPGISATEAGIVLEKIRLTLQATPVKFGSGEPPLTFSYGVAQASLHENAQDVLNAADRLMYQAKQAGRNQGQLERGATRG